MRSTAQLLAELEVIKRVEKLEGMPTPQERMTREAVGRLACVVEELVRRLPELGR